VSNPYAPTSRTDDKLRVTPKWLRRFFILNAVLLAIPTVLWIAVYAVNSFANNFRVDPATKDPVTYQHVVWVDINISVFVIYFLVPNMIFAIVLAVSRIRN
jgi:hypothetical protein